jgi:DNA mismatch repair protein MutL
MNQIIQLPKQISDKIAAGEVVTGPISVVKELVENSIDAGADSVTIEIRDGGKSYIRITDNGSGIPKEEVELAFLPHATSKIKVEDDLDGINTLGFRGEALTSIAAVSKLEMVTKTDMEKVGTSVYIEGGDIVEKKDVGTNTGTTIIVKDLYYNTPARLKFMKSDRAESTKIIDLISRLAIAYPNTKFKMINNGNILFTTNGKGDVLNNIFQVYGTDTSNKLLEIERDIDDYKIKAYISPSSQTKKTRKSQIYFVNGRVVNSKTIENAISKGYQEFLFEGRHPIAYLFLEINPLKLDVNVHPAKTEVRFNEQAILSEFISHTIYDRLKTKDAIPSILDTKPQRIKKQSPFKLDTEKNKETASKNKNETLSKSRNKNFSKSNTKTVSNTKTKIVSKIKNKTLSKIRKNFLQSASLKRLQRIRSKLFQRLSVKLFQSQEPKVFQRLRLK